MKHGPAQRLRAAAEAMGVPIDPLQAGVLVALLDRIALEPQNLTAIDEIDIAVDRHLADSVSGLAQPELCGPVADIGSGGGFPGLVIALLRPDLPVTLVESERRKAEWLRDASAALPNVRVVADRTEHLARAERGVFTTVTARAVAPLPVTLELAAPLVGENGHVLVWSTTMPRDAEAAADRAAAELGFRALSPRAVSPFPGARRALRLFRRVGPTPPRYPRRPGRAAARPLAS